MKWVELGYSRYIKLLSLVIVLLLVTSGCSRSNDIQPTNQNTSEEIIGVEIALPFDNDRLLIHSEDIELLQEELLSLGATQIKIVVEKEGEIITLNSPDEICADEYNNIECQGILKVYAEGDYDDLSTGLVQESRCISILQAFGFEVNISPYYKDEGTFLMPDL